MGASLSERDWQVRLYIYRHFAEQTRPPSTAEAATALGISEDDVQQAYRRLNEAHLILLDPGTVDVRIANPFSAIPTPHRVTANGRLYYANCAFDALGIPAILGGDATIESEFTNVAGTETPAHFSIREGELNGDGVVHFPLPFRQWYDDQIHT